MTNQNVTNLNCLCPTCNSPLSKKSRYTEMNVHLYIDNHLYPDLSDWAKILKSRRKLNKIIIESLVSYKQNSFVDLDLIKKSLLRIESVISISQDKAAYLSISKEIDNLRNQINL